MIVFIPLSLLSIGGGPSILAGIQNAVEARRWMSERDFIDLFAIARAAPGPGVLLATLVGWKVAGIPGALVASLALFVRSLLIYYAIPGTGARIAAGTGTTRSSSAWRRSPPA